LIVFTYEPFPIISAVYVERFGITTDGFSCAK
jgi:hypothetical protein